MDKYTVIKNGLVLTLDKKGRTGYFNLILRNNKIFLIDYEKTFNEKEFKAKNPDSEIIDASGKLIMPGFFNSKLISSYSLNKLFFKKCSYQNINSWLSLRLMDKYLSSLENAVTLRELLKITYLKSLMNGEIFLNESSPVISRDFFDIYFTDFEWIKQYYNFTAYDFNIQPDPNGKISFGFIPDEDINNYSLASIKKNLAGNKLKVFLDASLSEKAFDSIKKIFGRTFINVLSEMDLVSPDTVICNPSNLTHSEIEIIKRRKVSILFSPSDYVNLSDRGIDPDELISSGINIIIGTGYTGNDILSELKIFSTLISKNNLSYESLMRMAISNPSIVFGVSNLTGSIERNKSADMIFFEIDNFRNSILLPEIEKESLSEFIIQNLNSKDISDVMIRGEFLVRNGGEQISETDSIEASKDISQKLYIEGKYFEFREKELMRGRVDRLGLEVGEESEEERKPEIYVDMTESEVYEGEGEFIIIGAKEEEFEKPRERDIQKKMKPTNLKEIKSLEDDLNLFEGIEDTPEVLKPKKVKKKMEEKIIEDEIEIVMRNQDEQIEIKKEVLTESEPNQEVRPDSKPDEIKPSKLKFGFKDDE